MKGFGDQTKSKKKLNNFRTKQYHQQIMNEAVKHQSAGNITEAKKYYQMLIKDGLEDANVFNNYGIVLVNLGELKEAELSIRKSIDLNAKNPASYTNLGGILIKLGKFKEAELSIRKAIDLNLNSSDAHYILGNLFKDQDKFEDAEISIRKSIKLNPKDPEAHITFGKILIILGKLKEAELPIRKAIDLNPNSADNYYILGNLLRDQEELEDAEILIRKAIHLNHNFYEAYLILGILLRELGKLEEAELSAREAIKLNPNVGNAYLSLGIILRDLGRYEEAELFTLKAIKLENSDLERCYQNLSLLMYARGNINSAIENIEKAVSLDPKSNEYKLILSIFKKRNNSKNTEIVTHTDTLIHNEKCLSYPIIINKPVDSKLIDSLYHIKALDLNKFKDPSFGKARGSDYQLFENNEIITRKLEKELIDITKKIVNSDVFFRDSFFTILSGNSTVRKHNHLGDFDKLEVLKLWKQKYSLVYYLSIGDQHCQNPGILKFYKDEYDNNPNKEILPSEGMIVIFPADRYHSVKYDGNKDRIIIGVNFYSI